MVGQREIIVGERGDSGDQIRLVLGQPVDQGFYGGNIDTGGVCAGQRRGIIEIAVNTLHFHHDGLGRCLGSFQRSSHAGGVLEHGCRNIVAAQNFQGLLLAGDSLALLQSGVLDGKVLEIEGSVGVALAGEGLIVVEDRAGIRKHQVPLEVNKADGAEGQCHGGHK